MTGAILIYDLTTKTSRRLTRKNVQARSPVWADDLILFTKVDYVGYRMRFSVCSIRLDGTSLTTVVKNADDASYAAK